MLCAVATVAIPRTNQICFLLACGFWRSPQITAIALAVGYSLYLGLSTGREILDPHLTNDPFHRATVDSLNTRRPNSNFVKAYKQQKITGATLAIVIACIFVLLDTDLSSLKGFSYIGLLMLIASCGRSIYASKTIDPSPKILVDGLYFAGCLLIMVAVWALKIPNGIPLVGISVFIMPSVFRQICQHLNYYWFPVRISLPDYTDLDYETSPYLSETLVKQQTNLGWIPTGLAVLVSFVSPGVSSSAWGNLWYSKSVARRVVNASSETCIELLGVLLALQGLGYGGSFINTETVSISASFTSNEVVLLMGICFSLLVASNTFALPLYAKIRVKVPARFEMLLMLNFSLMLAANIAGFYGVIVCCLAGWGFAIIEGLNPDPHVRSFTFLPLVLLG